MTADSESSYAETWNAMFARQDQWSPHALAEAGGALARDLAQVFLAGYQAAIRATFPAIPFTGWAAFVVSEDRSDRNPLPGVTARSIGDEVVLNGHKTWVAGVEHVAQLVVRAAGDAPGYYLVACDAAGLSLQRNPSPSMLPSLSQGRAEFNGVRLQPGRRLDEDQVRYFSSAEAFCIYTAFAAFAARSASTAQALGHDGILQMAETLVKLGTDVDFTDVHAMAEFDRGIQELRRAAGGMLYANDESWQRDQVLVAMYSKGLQARASR